MWGTGVNLLVLLLQLVPSSGLLLRPQPHQRTRIAATATSSPDLVQPVLRSGITSEGFSLLQPQTPPTTSLSEEVRCIYSVAVADGKKQPALSARIGHATSGPVPRPYNPTVLSLEPGPQHPTLCPEAVQAALEEALRWYLDAGGRIGKLTLAVPAGHAVQATVEGMGFRSHTAGGAGGAAGAMPTLGCSATAARAIEGFAPTGSIYFVADGSALLGYAEGKAKSRGGGGGSSGAASASAAPAAPRDKDEMFTLHDLVGRLHHDLGNPKAAVAPYTQALIVNPASSAAFRNLGAAYHASGNTQLAFASYQQAIQLDAKDAQVYLKLALFYEDFAHKDWADAADHALRCYAYYLEHVDAKDTSVLTRMGNLQVREHRNEGAIETYSRALQTDPLLSNVWFNLAQAQVKVGDTAAARSSLQRTLDIDPSVTAAGYMLKALSAEEASRVRSGDEKYVRELFDTYAATYDSHGKKLLYSAPRVIRQEMAAIYRGRFTISSEEETVPLNLPSEQPGCTTIIPTIAINSTLDVLDLGCGTGLAGAWLKDYARSLTGVDLSEAMVAVARKKMLYQELSVVSINTYLGRCNRQFDLVVMADVLSYVGCLKQTFAQIVPVTRAGGHVAFTVEAVEGNKDATTGPGPDAGGDKGYMLLKSGRFGYTR